MNIKDFTPLYVSEYISYDEVYGSNNIHKYVVSKIPNKEGSAVYIVGHSLGGWNGAHLSSILNKKGYKVELLITLDPVGSGVMVKAVTDIYSQTPTPKAEFWINIFSDPTDINKADVIANLGEQWVPSARDTDIFHISKKNHEAAGEMFKENLPNDQSCESMLRLILSTYLGKE